MTKGTVLPSSQMLIKAYENYHNSDSYQSGRHLMSIGGGHESVPTVENESDIAKVPNWGKYVRPPLLTALLVGVVAYDFHNFIPEPTQTIRIVRARRKMDLNRKSFSVPL